MRRSFIPLLLAVSLVGACTTKVRPLAPLQAPGTPSYTGPPLLRWVFEGLTRDGEPYTRAYIVITGKTVSTYTVGTFYGGVARVMVRGDEGGDHLPEDALSGFIIFIAGAGHEVYAGYDRSADELYIKSRKVQEEGGAGPFSIIKTIPMKGRGIPVPVK